MRRHSRPHSSAISPGTKEGTPSKPKVSTALRVTENKGAGDRARTGDVQLGKLAFYQLNYARNAGLNQRAGIYPARHHVRY